eukprot:jgi/Hompol1/1643/HPOL_001498-RA
MQYGTPDSIQKTFINVVLFPLLVLPTIIAFCALPLKVFNNLNVDSNLFYHGVFMSLFIILSISAILLNQMPTDTQMARAILGVLQHWRMQFAAILSATIGFIMIFGFKINFNLPHFTSNHGILGITTLALVVASALIAALLRFCSEFFGGPESADKLIKFHRAMGYAACVGLIATCLTLTSSVAMQYFVDLPTRNVMFWCCIWSAFALFLRLRYWRLIGVKVLGVAKQKD